MDDIEIDEMFSPPDDEDGETPGAICQRLVETCDEFEHLRVGEARIVLMMRESWTKGGALVLGQAHIPAWQGQLRPLADWMLHKLFGPLDFLILLNRNWWRIATPIQREALLFHELYHCAQAVGADGELRFTDAGMPVWAIRPHDIEEFGAVVRRYGAWIETHAEFFAAAREGGAL